MKRNLLSTLFVLSTYFYAHGQQDSVKVNFQQFIQIVSVNHPISKQGELILESGEANMTRARGSFDPEIKSTYDQKQFDGKDYFRLNSNELKIPTPLGLELKAGYDNNQGIFVNPENFMPDNGLAYAGIALPLGQGLLFDERRQQVKQAKVFERSTELERTLLMNNLILNASQAYWDWFSAWNTFEIFDESVRLAEFRLFAVKESFRQGDIPAIDTLEAFILVQNRQLSRNDALIKLQKAKLEASNFLWNENLDPLILADGATPIELEDHAIIDPLQDETVMAILDDVDNSHPKIQLFYNKLEHLNYERRMKAEKVKPKLDINYNFLNQPVGGNPLENYSTNDFKWGFNFSMPILLRKGRGDLQLTKIKIQRTDLDRQEESLSIKNKIRGFRMEMDNLFGQITIFQDAVENYQRLLNGEKRKFEEGESSLFIVNSRETSLINAEVKLIELQSKYEKAQAGLINAMGGFPDPI